MKKQLALLLLSVGISHAAPVVYVDQFPPTFPYAGTAGSPLAGIEFATRFVVPPGSSISGAQISYRVGISGTATPGTLFFSIYNQTGGLPGTLLATQPNTVTLSGTDVVATGSVTASNTLASGTYWGALSSVAPVGLSPGLVATGSSYVPANVAFRATLGGPNWILANFGVGFGGFVAVVAVKIAGLSADPFPAENGTMETLPGVTFKTLYPAAINDDAHLAGGDHDVTVGGAIDEVHLVLQAGAAAADDGYAQGTMVGPALLLEQAEEAVGGIGKHLDEFFIANFEAGGGGGHPER